MEPANKSSSSSAKTAASDLTKAASAQLRLYVARSTPNSVRATSNLAAALASLDSKVTLPNLEIIDTFLEPKRAIREGVIVTPTLIGLNAGKRVVLMGDLSDPSQLNAVLSGLLGYDWPGSSKMDP